MKLHENLVILALMILLLPGCYIVRDREITRDDYFQPVTLPQQKGNTSLMATEADRLKNQLESANAEASNLRDSLSILQKYTGSLLISTRALIDKISELEAREFLSDSKRNDLEQNVAILKSENEKLNHKFDELQAQFASNRVYVESPDHARSSIDPLDQRSYNEALLMFYQKNYHDAIFVLKGLLEKGIPEDLNDNCEYWIGECHFGRREYRQAVVQFQKVLTIPASNKKGDACFMLGRSYEHLQDLSKAHRAYSELIARYPLNEHTRATKSRIAAINKLLPAVKHKLAKRGNSSI